MARGAAAAAVLAVVVLSPVGAAGAHPLGNVSVNHYAGLVVGTDAVEVDYVLDLAEIPTVQARQVVDADDDGELSPVERTGFAERRCAELADGLDLRVDGDPQVLAIEGTSLDLLPGTAGLDILRLECDLRAPGGVDADGTTITLVDGNQVDRPGWREITAVGDGTTLARSDVPESSTSERLAVYPEDGSQLDRRDATVVADPGGAAAPAITSPFATPTGSASDSFTRLISSDRVTIPFVVLALAVASVFGAVHALAPGHGKTVIAAYLVGQHADRRMALVLGATVAVTHTVSVLAFGTLVWASETIVPERLYPAFGVLSGALFVVLGVHLLRQVVRRRARPGPPSLIPVGPGGDHRHPHEHPVDQAPDALRRAGASTPQLALAFGTPLLRRPGHGHDRTPAEHGHAVDTHGHDHDHDHHHHDHDHEHGVDTHHHQHDHDHGVDTHHHGHDHEHGVDTHHHGHDHEHGDAGWHGHRHVDLDAVATGAVGWRQVVLPGLAGGLVPSPSALLVFLGGLALGRVWFGLGLVLGYGIGIALTLVAAGWLLSHAGAALRGRVGSRPGLRRLVAWLPATTAVLVILGGLHVAVRAATGL